MSAPSSSLAPPARRPHCCHLDDGDISRGCPQPARFTVYSPPFTVDDYTQLCGDHVADHKRPGDLVERISG
jgi:hypothetical protein